MLTTAMTKVLFLITSASHLGETPTGLWMEELATPYFHFKTAGYDVTIASPAGGPAPLDSDSLRDPFFTEDAEKFLHDADAMEMLTHTKKLADLKAEDYDLLYLTGGHGTCADFINDASVKSAIERAHSSGKIVAAVCHGVIALAECVKPDGSTPLVKGMTVTGFSNEEEEIVAATERVPFLVETRFVEQGATYEKADTPFGSHVCVDGNLVTGQNPASSLAMAKKVVEMVE